MLAQVSSSDDSGGSGRALFSVAQVAFIAAAALVVFVFVSAGKEGESRRRCGALCMLRPAYAGVSLKAPAFALRDMQGKEVTLESFRGKVVVLNFWTKTCRPCMEEMPAVAELAKVLKTRTDVALLAVSTDEGPESVKDALAAALREEAPFPVLFDPDGDRVVNAKFGTRLFPETWILDKRGVVRARFDGARDWSNSAVLELVDQVRGGGFCPVEIRDGKATGEAAKLCESFGGS